MTDTGGFSRRELLAGATAATAAAAGAGCTQRVRSIVGRDSSSRVSLSIASVPADEDDATNRIARHLRSNLDAVGISTSVDYYDFQTFWLEVLVNQSFDIAVAPHPGGADPDILYGMFHSRFSAESGWQNPYGITDIELDELLEQQRAASGPQRAETVAEILEVVAREQPVAPVCAPTDYRLAAPDRVPTIESRTFDRQTDLLRLVAVDDRQSNEDGNGEGETANGETELSVAIRDASPTRNLNPLAVEGRNADPITGLLYDSLAVRDDDGLVPWLARSVEWTDGDATVTLREATWHDGEPVTAEDVAFTYQLLADTAMGNLESPIPAPRFRGRREFVSDIEVHDEQTVTLSLAGDRNVSCRVLTVPILPEHVWTERTDLAEAAGVLSDNRTTEVLVSDNIPPVGSGPYEFVDRDERNDVLLEQRPDHFAVTADDLDDFGLPATRIEAVVAPSDAAAHEWVQDGDVELTLSPIWHETASEAAPELVAQARSSRFYHLAYNTRERPLSNTLFRRLVSRLLDKSWVAEEVFGGHARPAVTPMTDDAWIPDSLAWTGTDPEVPFFGSGGHLDADAARDEFVDLGYQYTEDGDLVAVGEN